MDRYFLMNSDVKGENVCPEVAADLESISAKRLLHMELSLEIRINKIVHDRVSLGLVVSRGWVAMVIPEDLESIPAK